MPEGPEIRRMVDDIHQAVGGQRATKVFFAFERLKDFENILLGRRIERVEARSKAVLVFFEALNEDGPWCVYSHNQLYGKWRIGRPDREPKTSRQLRFSVSGPKKAARLYSASDIQLIRPDALNEVPYLSRLGPDPLNQPVTVAQLLPVFATKRFHGRYLGGLLLDQGFVAGIGNYLRSEILFEAKISPWSRPRDLGRRGQHRLADAILTMVYRTYRLKGITNTPDRAERLRSEGWTFGQRRHMVFNRDAAPCHDCGTAIVRTVVASRRLYYCPVCQTVPS